MQAPRRNEQTDGSIDGFLGQRPDVLCKNGNPAAEELVAQANVNRGVERKAAEDARRILLISRPAKAVTRDRLTATSPRTAEACAPRRARAAAGRGAD